MTPNQPPPIIERARKYLEDTDYLYDSGASDHDRSEALPEHRQTIRDLIFMFEKLLGEQEQKNRFAERSGFQLAKSRAAGTLASWTWDVSDSAMRQIVSELERIIKTIRELKN